MESTTSAEGLAESTPTYPEGYQAGGSASGKRPMFVTVADTAGGGADTSDCLNSTNAGPLKTTVLLPKRESYVNAVRSLGTKSLKPYADPFKPLTAESTTNSTMQEHESVLSSWADDDQCFWDSILMPKSGCDEDGRKNKNKSNINTGGREGRGGRGLKVDAGGDRNSRRRRNNNHNTNNNSNSRRSVNNNRGLCFRGSKAESQDIHEGNFFFRR